MEGYSFNYLEEAVMFKLKPKVGEEAEKNGKGRRR